MLIHVRTTGITAAVFQQFKFREGLHASATIPAAEALMKPEKALQRIHAKVQRRLSAFPAMPQTAYLTTIRSVPQII